MMRAAGSLSPLTRAVTFLAPASFGDGVGASIGVWVGEWVRGRRR
jgi:hypothetical protein